MKKTLSVVLSLSIFSLIMQGCSFFKEPVYSELKPGETFYWNRDGYYEKISNRYYLDVRLRTKTSLVRIPDGVEWDYTLRSDNTIIEKHFIEGFLTSEKLVMCEEKEDDSLEYYVFDLSTAQIQRFLKLDEVYKLLNVDSVEWSNLCNTNKEIRAIK